MQILALADDLTGALEVGAKFAGCGLPSLVTTQPDLRIGARVRALVIDTETRHVPAGEAGDRVYTLCRAARERGIEWVYKKTDSALRGNIGSELEALLDAFPGGRVRYAPAYPKLGRTVRQGRLYVDGRPIEETAFARDPLNPIHDGYIPRRLPARCTGAVDVHDGECDADVARVAEMLLRDGVPRLAAGPAALAEAIAERMAGRDAGPRAWPVIRRCLVVNGSRHDRSLAQVRYAEERACTGPSDWIVLALPERAGEAALEYAARVGQKACARLRETRFDALAVFGGDTAFAILGVLGLPALEPVGEVLPGVPLSRIEGHDLYLITKAGGFGAPDVLCVLRNRLS